MIAEQIADLLRAAGYGAWIPVLLAVNGLAGAIAAAAPPATSQSSRAWQITRLVLDLLGCNWGNARNARAALPAGALS